MLVLKVKVISLPYIFQVLYVLCFTWTRYQVSVYRTIGPLICVTLSQLNRLCVFLIIIVYELRICLHVSILWFLNAAILIIKNKTIHWLLILYCP